MSDPLELFSQAVAGWFRETFGAPTPPQADGWPAIARGDNTLVIAPTGSGKTLTAFLWALDSIQRELANDPTPGIRTVYVSPLKALNNDVERNLEVPLRGIARRAERDGIVPPRMSVAVRTGDTPSSARQGMLRRPPHILITTPESLYLMLTSERARTLFATTESVIVDEIHTLVGSKRGAHLALTLERLERASERRLQRIGLSATVRPLEEAARFLGGQDPAVGHTPRAVTVVDAAYRKPLDLRVETVSSDFRTLGGSAWTEIIPRVVDLIDAHRTTLVFCNSRRLAERTADRLNERRLMRKLAEAGVESLPVLESNSYRAPHAAEWSARTGTADIGLFAVGVDASQLEAAGLQPIRAHHGSMSRTARLQMEGALKAGTLPALVATSSLELGIDIGDVDLVVHLQSPKSVSSGLQRVGRSGHLVGQTSKGRIFPTFAEDVMEAAAVAHGMQRGEIESTHSPENPLDVLAQQIQAMVGLEDWSYADLFALVRAAYPFRNLGEASYRAVLEMLSGRYPAQVHRHLKARIVWDRVHDRLSALPGARLMAVQSGGTIPDRGTYSLVMSDRRTRVGELDEEFVFETRKGDTFLLGSQVWRTLDITEDRVVAEPAPGEVPRMPFWRGDFPWRPYDLGRRIGAFRRQVVDFLATLAPADVNALATLSEEPPATESAARLRAFLEGECALDRNAVAQVISLVHGQIEAVGHVASDRCIVVELFEDELGDPRMVVHSPFGGRVNGPWGIALAGAIRERLGVEAQINSSDDGILLRFSGAEIDPPSDLIGSMTAAEARERLLAELPHSAVFGAQFRMNAARALVLPRLAGGKRTPLWLSRLRAKDLMDAVRGYPDFPILLETYRDCLRDVMDLDGLVDVLQGIQSGEIQVVVHEAEVPSPLAYSLDQRFAMRYVYEYDQPRGERQLAALSVNRALLAELLQDGSLAELLKPEAIAEVASRVAHIAPDARVRTVEELAQLLYDVGDLSDGEIAARASADDYWGWIGHLAGAGRILERQVGGQRRWVHAERAIDYDSLADRPGPVLRRWLSRAAPSSTAELAARYGLAEPVVRGALEALEGDVVAGVFTPGDVERWIDRRNLEQIHRRTLTLLRREVQPTPLAAYAAFLARWQRVSAPPSGTSDLALSGSLQQLRGVAVPGVAWERDVLPVRVHGFEPRQLAELCAGGELIWTGEGGKDARRARVRLFFRGEGGLFLAREPDPEVLSDLSDDARAILETLRAEGAALLADLVEGTGRPHGAVRQGLVELVLAGLVTNDTLAALHQVLAFQPPAPSREPLSALESQLAELMRDRPRPIASAAIGRQRMREARRHAAAVVRAATRSRESGWVGRWSLVHRPSVLGKPLGTDELAARHVRLLLTRWGVVTKASLERESAMLRWESLYPVLAQLEVRGQVRRGYFVEGLPGVQFALPEAVEQLRTTAAANSADDAPLVLNAADPAQLFGTEEYGGQLRFPRVGTSAVALVRGDPVAVVDEGGSARCLLEHPRALDALRALAAWWAPRLHGRLRVDQFNGEPAARADGVHLLEAAGFVRDYDAMVFAGRS